MSRTTLWLHAALCVLALGFAWRTAHTEKEKKGGPSVTVLIDADKGDVVAVDYTWDKGSTKTVVAGSAKMRSAVVDVDREVPKKAPPKKKDDKNDKDDKDTKDQAPAALVEEAAEREKATLPGGKNVITAIEALEPLKTLRTLGVVDDARLAAMGLQPALRSLTVTTKKKTLVLELGEASYGAQGRYARVKGDAVVHLIDAAIVTGLEGGADSLLEKRLLTAELDAINGFAVKSTKKDSEKVAAFIHVDKDQASTRYFAKKDDPGSKDEAAGKLMTSLRNLRGNKLYTGDAGEVVAAFVVDVAGAAVTIEIVERADNAAADSAVGYVARVGRWVYELTATQSKELFDDVSAL